jgi:signal transduction histidine kinase
LEKIIFNFLANALKFTDAGGTIALGYRRLDSGEIRIEVTDTGIGISEEDIKRLFSAFTQLDDSEARKVEGTGLGLALSKQLAEYMGGQVGVSSVVGEGSTFYLDIHEIEVATEVESLEWSPREWLMAEHQQRRGELRSDDASELSIVHGRGKSVLIVDDLPDMRALLTSLLEAQGYHVIEASDGQEALTLASRQPLDLMITDWMMPEMSGPELIASLRELPGKQGLPIILLTANADERARIEGVDTGADAFLSKPFQNRELLATVRNLLSLKVREGELENLVIELRQTQEQLVAQSRMATLGELASGLAHEIRNPMNLAQGGVEEISEALKEPERDAAFDKQVEGLVSLIQRGIDRIESVIGRLHRLSQVRKSKVGGSSDLAAVVEDLRSFLNLSEAGRGAKVELEIPEGIEVGLDSGALNQVLLNLSLNAIQAGGKDVTLRLTYEPHSGDELAGTLHVTDNGPGIPEEVGERIFEPFYTGRAEGTGLGLPLCRTIVREAGGRLWLDSDYKEGASFCIELPRPTEDDSLKVQAVASETTSSA